MVRTTVSIADDTHEQLMLRSFREKKPLGKIIDEIVANPVQKQSDTDLEREAEKDLRFLKSLGKKLHHVNWAKEIREERDRDNA